MGILAAIHRIRWAQALDSEDDGRSLGRGQGHEMGMGRKKLDNFLLFHFFLGLAYGKESKR